MINTVLGYIMNNTSANATIVSVISMKDSSIILL